MTQSGEGGRSDDREGVSSAIRAAKRAQKGRKGAGDYGYGRPRGRRGNWGRTDEGKRGKKDESFVAA